MNLYFRTYGNGDPLIVLHGLFGASDNWNGIGKSLGVSNMVYLPDQRNHGRSPHADSHTYKDLADDLAAFMKMHGLASASILGHSMGGSVAMKLADDHEEMVDKLIVVDIAPRSYPAKHDEIFEAMFSLDLRRFSKRQEIDDALSQSIDDPGVRQFLMKNVGRRENGSFEWKLNLEVIRRYYDGIIEGPRLNGTFQKPVLFIKGGKSTYIREEDEPLIKRRYPKAGIVTIPNAGHWVHADAPNRFVGEVIKFLKDSTD